TPPLGKPVQLPNLGLPVGARSVQLGPGLEFVNDGQTLGLVNLSLLPDLRQPGLHHFVRFGTRLVEALPQGMVGLTTLVGRFPLIAQTAQRFLHLPATQTLALWRLQKTFGL